MEGISLGPLLLRWNGLLIALGVIFGALLFALELKRRGYETEIAYHLFMPLMIWGLIGARLWHIFTPPLSSVQLGLTTAHYFSHPLDALMFWIGGFGIPGAIIAGILVLYLFTRKYELPFWDLADMMAPGLALAMAIGRVGNYFNQELYGLPTEMPWAVFIDQPGRLLGYEQVMFYHPLYAYEAVMNLVNLGLLLWVSRRVADRFRSGGIFLIYLAFYSIVRFMLEFLRLDVALVAGVNANQVFFALLFIASTILLWRRRVQVL